MRTHNSCLVCFLKQALATTRRSSSDATEQWRLTTQVGALLAGFDPQLAPPENAVHYYRYIAEQTGVPDPYAGEKKESNTFAMALETGTRQTIAQEQDPLLAAMKFAINANVLDYGSQHLLGREAILGACRKDLVLNDYEQLNARLVAGKKVLYLADNCGELTFDKLVVELLLERGCQVTLAVRDKPIINDATLADAEYCGLTDLCEVISNGADLPGTSLAACTDTFRQHFSGADCIISKGMGNFECLSEVAAPIFFLFIVKCSPVLSYLNDLFPEEKLGIGSPVLIQGAFRGR